VGSPEARKAAMSGGSEAAEGRGEATPGEEQKETRQSPGSSPSGDRGEVGSTFVRRGRDGGGSESSSEMPRGPCRTEAGTEMGKVGSAGGVGDEKGSAGWSRKAAVSTRRMRGADEGGLCERARGSGGMGRRREEGGAGVVGEWGKGWGRSRTAV
jgi:hypothetical protein